MKLNENDLIGIIGAMQSEIDKLLGLLSKRHDVVLGKHTFHIGIIDSHPVVISRAGVGKVNAAVCAASMIMKFSPAVIINIGVAGALDPVLTVGDVAVADSAVEHDLDYGVLGDPRGSIFYPDASNEIVMPTDKDVADALFAAASSLGLHTLRGTIASGDVFVSDPAKKADIRAAFGDTVRVCEMEGAAIVHVCRLWNVRCGVLRSVSDSADGNAEVDFPTFTRLAAENAANVLHNFIASV